jgi:hypothetical protein
VWDSVEIEIINEYVDMLPGILDECAKSVIPPSSDPNPKLLEALPLFPFNPVVNMGKVGPSTKP